MEIKDQDEATASPYVEAAERIAKRLATSVVIAAMFVSVAIYGRSAPSHPRFAVVASGSGIFRVDTKTGSVVQCVGQRCMAVLTQYERVRRDRSKVLPSPDAGPAQKSIPGG